MSDDALAIHDPFTEMKLLRMAYRLLIATNQLDNAADLLIAQQVLHVLEHGTRQAPPTDDLPQCTLREDALAPHVETVEGYDAVDVPNYGPIYFPAGDPEPEGFTIPDELSALGYRAETVAAFDAEAARVAMLVRREWTSRYHGEPIHKGELDWYSIVHTRWVDRLIRDNMGPAPQKVDQ